MAPYYYGAKNHNITIKERGASMATPMFIVTGFLDSGKTTMIKDTLMQNLELRILVMHPEQQLRR